MSTIGFETGTLAAFGWDWVEPDSGTQWELVNIKGTCGLSLGRLASDGKRWDTMSVSAPERFLTEPPITRKAWRVVVDRWFAAAEEF